MRPWIALLTLGLGGCSSLDAKVCDEQIIETFADADGDGFGDDSTSSEACGAVPSGRVVTPGDCDDDNVAVVPDAQETCDGLDNNCNGVVDDGLATGSSMLAAVHALRESEPAEIVIAVPAAPESTCREFAGLVEDVVCASMPTPFLAVGESFWDFSQVTDDEVRELLTTPTTGAPPASTHPSPADLVAQAAIDAPGGVPPADVLDDLIGDARVVLIGESSHGTHEFFRHGGSIGTRLTPGHVFKGKKMPGQMGNARVTTQNLRLHSIDAERNLIFIIGAVPGSKGGVVEVRPAVKRS